MLWLCRLYFSIFPLVVSAIINTCTLLLLLLQMIQYVGCFPGESKLATFTSSFLFRDNQCKFLWFECPLYHLIIEWDTDRSTKVLTLTPTGFTISRFTARLRKNGLPFAPVLQCYCYFQHSREFWLSWVPNCLPWGASGNYWRRIF